MIKTKISIILFIWSILFYIIGLFGNFGIFLSNILFWIPSVSIIGIIVYQIINIKKINPLIILFEIIIFSIGLHLIFQVGYYGLRGSDSYFEYNLVKLIINNGFFNIAQENNSWPLINILFSQISLTSNINPLILSKFLPSFLSSALIIVLFLLIKKIYGNIKIALLSCLIFSTIPNFINFEGLFVKETMGIFLLLLLFFVIYLYIKKDKIYIVLILLLIPAMVLTHHFSSFLLAVFLFLYILLEKIIPKLKKVPLLKFKNIKYNKFKIDDLFLLILVSLFAYWGYVGALVLKSFGKLINEVTGINDVISYSQQIGFSSPIITIRGEIIFIGFFFFIFTFLVLQIIQNIQNDQNKPEEYLFTLFFIFCTFFGYLSLFFSGVLIYPDRMLTFAWLFGIIPVVALYYRKINFERLKKPFLVLLIVFMLFNLYNIDPDYINHDLSSKGLTGTMEYSIANTIVLPDSFRNNSSYDLYYGYGGVVGAIFDIQGIEPRSHGVDPYNLKNISSYIVIIDENTYNRDLNILEKKSPTDYDKIQKLLNYKNDINVDKIADVGSGIYVLKGTINEI